MSERNASVRVPVAVLLALLALAGRARAGDAPEVVAAKKGCDARQWADCQKLGEWYRDGYPVSKDAKKAVKLFKPACDGGHLPACAALAKMYSDGDDVETNKVLAGQLMEKACDGGDAEACFDMADEPSDYGVAPDRVGALYEKACNAGAKRGCYNGGIHFRRAGDAAHAAALYEKGCTAGDVASCYNGGTVLADTKDIGKDGPRAAAMLAKACDAPPLTDKNFKDLTFTACYNLGVLNANGTGIPKDLKKAHALYDKACQAKISDACQALEHVKVYEKNPVEARNGVGGGINFYLLQSCENGEYVGCRTLAEQYAAGSDGLPKNPARAAELWKKAAALDLAQCDKGGKDAPMACMELSRAYEEGHGVVKSAAKAAEIQKKALAMSQTQCGQGVLEECVTVGLAYQWGNGLPKDRAQALAFYKKACDAGHEPGCYRAKHVDEKP